MFICPWCGTPYAEFRSNCANCGGPMLPADADARLSSDEDIPVPPPAPRPISQGYAWKLALQGGRGVAGMVLALVGLIFTLVGAGLTLGIITAFVGIPFFLIGLILLGTGALLLFLQFQHSQNIVAALRDGEATRGRILDAEQNYSLRINGRNPWVIRYQFEAGGQNHEGSVSTLNQPGERLQAGKPVCILYLPGAPQWSSIYPHP